MAIDHFGLTKPGESWKAIEEGVIEIGGKCPINPSGGLIGAGHPVGATGVRQLLDAYLQVTDQAGDYQVEGREDVRDAEHRRQRHDQRQLRRRRLTPGFWANLSWLLRASPLATRCVHTTRERSASTAGSGRGRSARLELTLSGGAAGSSSAGPTQDAPLLLGVTAPDAVVLVRAECELQAAVLHRVRVADGLR